MEDNSIISQWTLPHVRPTAVLEWSLGARTLSTGLSEPANSSTQVILSVPSKEGVGLDLACGMAAVEALNMTIDCRICTTCPSGSHYLQGPIITGINALQPPAAVNSSVATLFCLGASSFFWSVCARASP